VLSSLDVFTTGRLSAFARRRFVRLDSLLFDSDLADEVPLDFSLGPFSREKRSAHVFDSSTSWNQKQ